MGRKEFIDPETADWPVRGAHVVAPVCLGLSLPEDVLILPPCYSARTMVVALSTLKNLRA